MKPKQVWAYEGGVIVYDYKNLQLYKKKNLHIVGAAATLDDIWVLCKDGKVCSLDNPGKTITQDIQSIKATFSEFICASEFNIIKSSKKGISFIHEGNDKIKKIVCGGKFALALMESGAMYHYGQAGSDFHFDREYNNKFTRTEYSNVVDCECGFYHAIVLQESRKVVSLGQKSLCFEPVDNISKIYAYGKSTFLFGGGNDTTRPFYIFVTAKGVSTNRK